MQYDRCFEADVIAMGRPRCGVTSIRDAPEDEAGQFDHNPSKPGIFFTQ